MNKKIIAIVSMNLALPLLLGASFVYAGVSEVGGNGEVAPSILALTLRGDQEKFQEDHWAANNAMGGVSEYSYINEDKHGGSIVADGRVIAGNNDYLFNFDLKKEEVGSLIFEFKQFRKYYDGTGGFFGNFAPTAASATTFSEINRTLFLDIGNLKIEGIFSKEENTKCIFSYEREYRQGAKSLISWGSVTDNTTTRKILPTFLEVDETVDKLNMKIEHTTAGGVEVSAEQAWEKIRATNQKCNSRTLTLDTGLFTSPIYELENMNSDIYTTTLRVADELNEKAFFSTAFLCNNYRGHTVETLKDFQGTTDNKPNNPAKVTQDTIAVLPKISISLTKDLLMDAGLKWEFVKKNGVAHYDVDKVTAGGDGTIDEFVPIETKIMENKLGENVNIKYDGIKDAVFYSGGDFEQQIRNVDESQSSSGPVPTASNNFSRDADVTTFNYSTTSGFKWYPMPKIDVTSEFKYRYGTVGYDSINTVRAGDVVNRYRGFINGLTFRTYKPLVKLNFKPYKWIACNFLYTFDTTIYATQTRIADAWEFNKYRANIYSTGLTLTPREYLYLTLFYQYKEASTRTQANGDGGRGFNVPTYNASFKVLSASCSYSPVKDITLRGSYSISKADNFNDFSNIGLPLGLTNFLQDASVGIEKKIRRDCSVEFKYDFMQYGETSNGGIDDYEAHLFYTALKMKF